MSSVTCHVTWRVMEMRSAIGFSNKKKANLFRLRAEASELRWLVFVFVSGTLVAPIES